MWPLSEVGEVLYRPSRARLAVEISQSRFPEDCEIGMLSKDHKRLVSIERFFLKASCWLWSLCWRPNFTSAYCVYPSVPNKCKSPLKGLLCDSEDNIREKVHSKFFPSDRAEPDSQWRFMLWLGVEESDLTIYWVTSSTASTGREMKGIGTVCKVGSRDSLKYLILILNTGSSQLLGFKLCPQSRATVLRLPQSDGAQV